MTSSTTLERLRIEPCPEFADILRDERFAASLGGKPDIAERINRAFDRLILQSGTRLSGAVVLRLCLLVALAFGGAVFVFSGNLLATGLATGEVRSCQSLSLPSDARAGELDCPSSFPHWSNNCCGPRGREGSWKRVSNRLPRAAPHLSEMSCGWHCDALSWGWTSVTPWASFPNERGLPECRSWWRRSSFPSAMAAI